MSKTPSDKAEPAPVIGEANDYVFGELLGMGSSGIEELSAEGVIS